MAKWASRILIPIALSLTFAAFVFGTGSEHDGDSSLDEENPVSAGVDDLLEEISEDLTQPSVTSFSLKGTTPQINKTKKSSLLLVSTLDGTLSALDVNNNGNVLWKLETSPGSMLSSSISKVEMRSRGRWVRLIPSLDGTLYKFDGDSIDPLPVSADSLLHSSYQVSDDLLITGGKEVNTYGIDAITGRLQYSCTRDGCQAEPPAAPSSNPFLIIRRHTKTVRAIEPRTGLERWNFSVGHHEAALLHSGTGTFADCHSEENSKDQMECFMREESNVGDGEVIPVAQVIESAVKFKVEIPDGSVFAFHPQGRKLWRRKFDSPVTHVWQLEDNRLAPVNMFSTESMPTFEEMKDLAPPVLYVGIHKQQVYIQESPKMTELVSKSLLDFQQNGETSMSVYRLAWNPLPINSLSQQSRPGRFTVSDSEESDDELPGNASTPLPVLNEDPGITALIIRHESEYPFDRGFYLLDAIQGNKSSPQSNETINNEEAKAEDTVWQDGDDITIEKVIIYYVAPLWVWWREVIFISLLTAVVFHIMITRQVIHLLRERFSIELQVRLRSTAPIISRLAIMEQINFTRNAEPAVAEPAVTVPESKIDIAPAQTDGTVPQLTSASSGSNATPTQYTSRYLTDFEPVQCLGRGGFGLVFEARNLLDDCHYAVKRIQLPNNQEAREKVMREVKALAKLDNPNIVRYFHAWIECPPPGWQECQDARWRDLESLTGPTSPTSNTTEHTESASRKVDSFSVVNEISSLGRDRDRSLTRRTTSDDSSFGVVFEDSKSSPGAGMNSSGASETSSGKAKKSLFQSPVGSAISLDESSSFDESDGFLTDDEDSVQFVAQPSPKPAEIKRPQRTPEAKMFLFIQMQLCRKESLREWLRAHVSHRDPYQVLHMFNEIIRAVEYVHLQGLIHRDLKPSNIFFAPDGAIKIGDFGLVTAMTEETGYYVNSPCHETDPSAAANGLLQRHTDQVGTQLYMSPEQIEGKPYNHKVDIYSLGLIFFELLWPLNTQMEQVTVISQLRKNKFPSGFTDKYPEEEKLLRKMLSRNPDLRPTTFGIRASPSLISHQDTSIYDIPDYLHFTLQRPRSTSFRTSSTSSNS